MLLPHPPPPSLSTLKTNPRQKHESTAEESLALLVLPILEDRSAILVAISQILNNLTSKKLDRPTASLCLYGLQIASQNVERKQDVLPFRAVESISLSREGDELGPELQVCDSSDNCSTCDQRETCPDFEEPEEEDES